MFSWTIIYKLSQGKYTFKHYFNSYQCHINLLTFSWTNCKLFIRKIKKIVLFQNYQQQKENLSILAVKIERLTQIFADYFAETWNELAIF